MIDKRLYANNAKTTIASEVSPTDTTILVTDASRFPIPGPGEYFLATVDTGVDQEIIKVQGNSGNAFTNCIRGYEGTTAAAYLVGTRIENRVTAGTLDSFIRKQERLAEIASVDLLEAPSNMDGNSYICSSLDDSANPVIAYSDKVFGTWRFSTHPNVVAQRGLQQDSELTKAHIGINLPLSASGSYILQFTSGVNKGLARMITLVDQDEVTWNTPLPQPALLNDTFEVYRSTSSILRQPAPVNEDGLIYSLIFSD